MVAVPPFFLPPYEPDDPKGEEVLEDIVRWADETTGRRINRSQGRIARLDYVHDGNAGVVEVGQSEPRIGETVVAILDSDPYLVCTPNRGVLRGTPILIGRSEVLQVVHFER